MTVMRLNHRQEVGKGRRTLMIWGARRISVVEMLGIKGVGA